MIKSIQFFLIVFLLNACSSSKSYTKKGNYFAEAGFYEDASKNYIVALDNNDSYLQARIGLKNSGQKYMDQLISQFFQAHSAGDVKNAVQNFRKADAFSQEAQKYKVELIIPSAYRVDYEKDKEVYLNNLYQLANQTFRDGKYKEAERIFQSIQDIDGNYKDVNKQRDISLVTPLYDEALQNYADGLFKTAYQKLSKIQQVSPNFKETLIYLKKAKEQAIFTIGLLPFENKVGNSSIVQTVYAYVLSGLVNNKNEFIAIIDRDNIQRLIDEQKLGMTGIVSDKSAVAAGELLGAKAVLVCSVFGFSVNPGLMSSRVMKGYESYLVKKTDPVSGLIFNELKYRKTVYTHTSGERKIAIGMQYKLISTQTGQILKSGVIEETELDLVEYAQYDGNPENLFSGKYKERYSSDPTDQVFDNPHAKRQLDQLLVSERDFKSLEDLKEILLKRAASKTYSDILAFERTLK